MRVYAAIGNRALIIRQYEQCRVALLNEVDAPPSFQTQALFNAINPMNLSRPTGWPEHSGSPHLTQIKTGCAARTAGFYLPFLAFLYPGFHLFITLLKIGCFKAPFGACFGAYPPVDCNYLIHSTSFSSGVF